MSLEDALAALCVDDDSYVLETDDTVESELITYMELREPFVIFGVEGHMKLVFYHSDVYGLDGLSCVLADFAAEDEPALNDAITEEWGEGKAAIMGHARPATEWEDITNGDLEQVEQDAILAYYAEHVPAFLEQQNPFNPADVLKLRPLTTCLLSKPVKGDASITLRNDGAQALIAIYALRERVQ